MAEGLATLPDCHFAIAREGSGTLLEAGKTFSAALVVDDDGVVRGTIARLLGELGLHRVTQAGSAAEALALLARERPEVILTDWAMETGSAGLDVVRAAEERGIAVMVLSGSLPEVPPGSRPVAWLQKADLTLTRLEQELERLRAGS